MVRISRTVSRIVGTSANLIENDTLSVNELMYGMMLPSGNDAAVALGTHFGSLLKSKAQKDPEIFVTAEAVERRLRALKIVKAREKIET